MTKKQISLLIILSLTGLIIWVMIGRIANTVEAWDSMYYYLVGLPLMCAASAIAGYLEPKSPYVWGISILILQPVVLLFQTKPGPLILVGLVFFGFFAAFTIGCAYLGSSFRKKARPS